MAVQIPPEPRSLPKAQEAEFLCAAVTVNQTRSLRGWWLDSGWREADQWGFRHPKRNLQKQLVALSYFSNTGYGLGGLKEPHVLHTVSPQSYKPFFIRKLSATATAPLGHCLNHQCPQPGTWELSQTRHVHDGK